MDNTKLHCSVCGTIVTIIDGKPQRECEHIDAPVVAEMEATVYGEGGMQ